MNNPLFTPKTLWQDFDAGLPLEAEITKEYDDGGARVSEIWFSGRASEFGRVRIFGTLCRSHPESSEVIVVIGDRENPASLGHYRSLLEKFNLFLFDYAGANAATPKHTYYPEQLCYANAEEVGAGFERAERSARETAVYEWCAVSRYAVSMAESLGFERIGLLGVRQGANLALMVSAMDERVCCAVSCFGGGWGRYRRNFKYGPTPDPVADEEFSRYVAGCGAENYAQNVNVPFLFLSSSNNKCFQMDRINDTVARMPAGPLFSFAPRLSNQLDGNSSTDMALFFEEHLSGGEHIDAAVPQWKIEVVGGKIRVRLLTPAAEIVSAKVYFSSNQPNPAIRDWREADLSSGEAFLTVYEGEETLFAYPHVTFRNGYTLSGKLSVLSLSDVKKEAFLPSQVLYTSAMGTDTFTTYGNNINTVFEQENVFLKKGAFGIEGLCDKYNRLATYKVNDARFRFHVDNLNFDLCTRIAQTIRVVLRLRFNTLSEEKYTAEVAALGGDMWQPVTLNVKDFKSANGSPLKSFEDVNMLLFRSESETLFNNILWV